MKIRLMLAAALLAACFGHAAEKSPNAISRLLNSRASGSTRGFVEAAEIVSAEAAKGLPVQQFVIGVLSTEDHPIPALRLSKEKRMAYLDAARGKIRALAENRSNGLAWYLLSLENNDMKLLKRASECNNLQALNAWGTITLTQALSNPGALDSDVEGVLEKSFNCFRRAAAEKDPNGLYNLGMCYMRGYGCNENRDKAFECFRTAAEAGHPEAINNIGGFYRDGIVVEKDPVLATRWFAKSADCDNSYGMLNYGLALQRGEGVARDPQKAAELFKGSADQGNAEAMNAYAMCLFNGDGVAKDERAGVQWYRRSASAGCAEAMDNLASCYDRGLGGLPESALDATVWKVRARAARGDRNAMAWLTQNGHGMR